MTTSNTNPDAKLQLQLQIKIKQEYNDLVYPLSDAYYLELKNSIKENGQYVPIIVNKEGFILDGHHRFKICKELGVAPDIIVKDFEPESENKLYEKLFVIDSNLKRRHLNNFQKIELALKTKPILEEIARKNTTANLPTTTIKDQPSVKHLAVGRVNNQLGKHAKISHETVRKVEIIQEKATEKDIDKLRKGEKSINQVFKEIKTLQKKQELVKAMEEHSAKLSLDNSSSFKDRIQLIHGDCFEKCLQIADNSIDLIFTDPPYNKESLYLYGELAKIASRVLKEGGSLVTFQGNY